MEKHIIIGAIVPLTSLYRLLIEAQKQDEASVVLKKIFDLLELL